ncbi:MULTISPECIES: DNA gyrase inhibitor YacG [unclassified Bartonella]|uniref:DNA gyrase inhibitor YacG n=1 Tax=unclassified Bartonella TaxID=2645622 RepID=UPI002361C64F|nr:MULTISPECIES: DNA gyrase inhibitor YacG [unclassified Bartonella]
MIQNTKQSKRETHNEKKQTVEKVRNSCQQITQTQQTRKKSDLTQSETTPIRPPHPCPICGQMAQQNTYPFCSTRCRAIDLNRWLSGAYILPPPPQVSDEEE